MLPNVKLMEIHEILFETRLLKRYAWLILNLLIDLNNILFGLENRIQILYKLLSMLVSTERNNKTNYTNNIRRVRYMIHAYIYIQ